MENKDFDWYVIRTKPRSEVTVRLAVEAMGYRSWLPLIQSYRLYRGRKQKKDSVLIPGYVFVESTPVQCDEFKYVRGSVGILHYNSIPVALRNEDIERLKRLCRLETPPEVCSEVTQGQKVLICSGPLSGFEGVVCNGGKPNVVYLESGLSGITLKVDLKKNEIMMKDR